MKKSESMFEHIKKMDLALIRVYYSGIFAGEITQ